MPVRSSTVSPPTTWAAATSAPASSAAVCTSVEHRVVARQPEAVAAGEVDAEVEAPEDHREQAEQHDHGGDACRSACSSRRRPGRPRRCRAGAPATRAGRRPARRRPPAAARRRPAPRRQLLPRRPLDRRRPALRGVDARRAASPRRGRAGSSGAPVPVPQRRAADRRRRADGRWPAAPGAPRARSTGPSPENRLLPKLLNRESTAISGWVKRKTTTRSSTVDMPRVKAKPFTSPMASM